MMQPSLQHAGACGFLLRADHPCHDLGHFDGRTPVEHLCRLSGIAKRVHDVTGANKGRIVINVISPIETDFEERCRYEFLERMGDTRSDNEIIGLVALQHPPHGFDIIGSPAPVAAER